MPLGMRQATEIVSLHHYFHVPAQTAAVHGQATGFNEWSCPRWTGEVCHDGTATSCKRGATGEGGQGLSCVEKRCVCKEHSCYVGGHCVQDGCHVAAAQVSAIQSVGGITAPNAQLAAIRAGREIEEQALLQQAWMPPTGENKVQFLWSQEAEDNMLADSDLTGALQNHLPVVNRPLSKEQIQIIETQKGKSITDKALLEEMSIKQIEKVAYFWTDASKEWVEGKLPGLSSPVNLFDVARDESLEHHTEAGQPLSEKQIEVLDHAFGDWKHDGMFEIVDQTPATYHWTQEGIAKFRHSFPRAYEEMTSMFGPLKAKGLVHDMAKKAFEDRYGTMERVPMAESLFVREEGRDVAHGSNDPMQLQALSDVQATISMPVYQNDTKGSAVGGCLEGVLQNLKGASENLEGLADHRIDIKPSLPEPQHQAIDLAPLIVAGFAPCPPSVARSLCEKHRGADAHLALSKTQWRQFFPSANVAVA